MADVALMPEHEARRYRLNQFISGTSESWLPAPVFYKCQAQGIEDITGCVLAVDVTATLDHATISAAKKVGDKVQTELVASLVNPTEGRLYEMLVSLLRTTKATAIVVDGGRMPNLQKRLKQNGLPLWSLWSKEVAAAASTSFSLFQQGLIEWNGTDQLLIAQVPRGVVRYSGENWFLSRRDSFGDIDAVTSTLMAVYVSVQHQPATIGVF